MNWISNQPLGAGRRQPTVLVAMEIQNRTLASCG